MWPFSRRPSRPSAARNSRLAFRPNLEALDDRTMMSHKVSFPVPITSDVLAFAKSHVGQIVGNGQCATLAQAAVKAAGGVPFNSLGPTGSNADYVWGKLVTTLTPTKGSTAGIVPGDILQFSKVTEVDTMTVRYNDGRVSTSTTTHTATHHTAIVSQVGGSAANDIQVFQSNVKLYQNEALSQQLADQGGNYWGGSSTRTTNYPQYGFSITVTHTMTSGIIHVYQPYKNISITVPF